MKKRFLATILSLCMALTMLTGTASAKKSDTDIAYPVTGGNIYFDPSTGTITGCDNYRITNAVIPSTINGVAVTSIGDWAFNGCGSLTSVSIPSSVTSIGDLAFNNCDSLTSVAIPSSVTSIGGWAFDSCTSLTSVAIPSSVTSIGEGAFTLCSGLISVDIPSSVTSIGENAFQGCTSLTNVVIPSSVTSIGNSAFNNCTSLTSVAIPSSVTSIGDYAFERCRSLTSVDIPSSVTSIGDFAFERCTSLTSVAIPSSVTSIGYAAFEDCTSLTDIYYSGSEEEWGTIKIGDHNWSWLRATIHYNAAPNSSPAPDARSEYIYDVNDPGDEVTLPVDVLDSVTDPATAVDAVNILTTSMTAGQKESATGIDLATLYAETAVSKAASKEVNSNAIVIDAATVADLQTVAAQTSAAVESALTDGGIAVARQVADTVTLTTDATGEIAIQIDPDILTTQVDKVRVETPTYALTFKIADLEEDLTGVLTFTVEDVGTGFAVGKNSGKVTVKVTMPKGKTTNPVTISLPKDSGNTTYQAVVTTEGTPTSSKYNPATTTMDGKVTTSGSYTVKTNEKDFTDISNKSAEMQSAIRYLASKGIITGTTDTTFSPDSSISRAEIAALLVRALGKFDSSATTSFSDVTSSNWFYSAAASSQKHGLINGYSDNTFRGTTTINKEQIVVVAGRVLTSEMGYKAPSNTSTYLSKYSDSVVDWAQPEVALATRENLVVYRTDGTFSGAGNMTRGDAAIIIYRLFQRIW